MNSPILLDSVNIVNCFFQMVSLRSLIVSIFFSHFYWCGGGGGCGGMGVGNKPFIAIHSGTMKLTISISQQQAIHK